MSKSRNNIGNKSLEPSRDTVVDWDSLLSLIAAELDVCIKKLRGHRRRVLEVRKDYFPGYDPSERPSIKGLENLESALGGLERGIGDVVRRCHQFRAGAFQDIVSEAIRDRKEASSPDFLVIDPE